MEFHTIRTRFGVAIVASVLAVLAMSTLVSAAPHVRVGPGLFAQSGGNPANIGVSEPSFRLTLLPVDFSFRNNTWPLLKLDHYLDKEITQDVKDDLLQAMPGSGFQLGVTTASAVDLGVSVISANLAIRTLSTANLAEDLWDVVLNGNELNKRYTFDGTMAGTTAYGDASIGLSLPLGDSLRVGARYHRLMGAGYAEGRISGSGEIIFTDDETGFDGDIRLEYLHTFGDGVRGEGSAFDVGVSLQLSKALAVGLAVMDVGEIEWKDVTREVYEGVLSLDPGSDQGPEFSLVESELINSYAWNLPRRYEVSLGFQLARSVHLGAAYTKTAHESTRGFVQEDDSRIHTMLSWTGLGIVPVGVGTTYSSADGLTLSGEAGLRLGPLRTRARITDIQLLLGKSEAKGLGFAVDLGFVF